MARWLALACVLGGCHPYIAAGLDATGKAHGPLANVMSTPVATARTTSAAEAPTPAPSGNSYSLAVGGGSKDFTIEGGFHVHDVAQGTFALPDPATIAGTPHYAMGSASLDFRWSWLRFKHWSTNVHAGPAVGLVLDCTSGAASVAEGFRYGAGLAVSLSKFSVFGDVYRTGFVFDGGPADGFSDLTGVTVGLAFQD